MRIEDVKREHLSKPKNLILADVFYKAGYIEAWGSGTLKIVKQCVGQGLAEPAFEENNGIIKLTFFKSDVQRGNVTEERHKTIMELMGKDSKITAEAIAQKLSVTRKTIVRDINELTSRGLIVRMGPDKGGYWKVYN